MDIYASNPSKAISGATVSFATSAGENTEISTTTDDSGYFELTNVPKNQEGTISVLKDGYQKKTLTPMTFEEDFELGVLTLDPASTYTVKFKSKGGTGTMADQTFTEGVAQKLSKNTFTKEGYTFSGWMSDAGNTYADEEEITVSDDMTLNAIWTHTHDLTHYEAKDATCAEPGNIEYWHCNTCDKYFSDAAATHQISKEETVIPAEGHDWDEGTVTKEPTCTETGTKTYTCKKCWETKTEIIPAEGHDLDHFERVEPTCTEPGNIEYWYCKKCDKYFKDEAATQETTKDKTIIPAEGHDLDHFARVEPTCTEPGNIEYWHCDRCGKYFSDEFATKEITQEQTVISALGHDWDEGVVTKKATTTDTGIKTYTCKRCGETKTEIIPATGSVVIKEGADGTYKPGSGMPYVVRIDIDIENFEGKVTINDNTLDTGNYDAKSGSTIISLHPDYLNTLAPGKYNVGVEFKEQVVNTSLTIEGNTDDTSTQTSASTVTSSTTSTSDSAPFAGLVGLFVVSAGAVVFALRKRTQF